MKQPLSYIHPNAKIAKNVVIEPFTSIDGDVEIGEGTWIGSNVSIMDGARIGKNCNIYPGAVISANPQDLKYNNEKTFVEIGNNVTIRECVTINKGTNDRLKTVIGSNCLIMAYSHVAHDCLVGDNCIFSNNTTLAGHVTVGDFVIISGLTAIHQFCSIGNHAFVTGGSLVRKDVPPYVKAGREPLAFIGVNTIGLSRKGFDTNQIKTIQDTYRILFQKKLNTTSALEVIEQEINNCEEKTKIIDFLKQSDRGIIKGYY